MIFNPASKSPLLLLLLLSLSVLSVSSCHFTRSPPGFYIAFTSTSKFQTVTSGEGEPVNPQSTNPVTTYYLNQLD